MRPEFLTADRPLREGLFTTITEFSSRSPVFLVVAAVKLAGGLLVCGGGGCPRDRKWV
ncbi:hypothetical protein [Microcoleus sp.]|uniref:hypothetical protein n=1 Tax=Microcoleus sp. TaxID=44472 RepID=UPI003593EEDC